MWKRNVLFCCLIVAALSSLAGLLWPRPPRLNSTAAAPSGMPADMQAAVAAIDDEFRSEWARHGLQPAPPADHLTLARRLAMGLLGTVPSVEEIRYLERLPEEQQLDWYVLRILQDRRYADYVAERLARAYVGTEEGPFLVYRRRRFVSWLSDQLHQNRAYDELVRDLISDEGLWTDSPAVNFVTVSLDQNNGNQPDPIRLAARTSRAFLGMRIDCLQCHDDMLGKVRLGSADQPREGLQSDFHQLAAFFGGAESSLFGIRERAAKQYQYQYLASDAAEPIPAQPPFLPELLPEDGSRRDRLAIWVTHDRNRPFARAAVNRVWGLLFGKPLLEPVDDIPLHGPFPPGLETLATDFIQHGYDLQRLVRIIVGSAAFHRDSRADFEVTEDHEQAWAVFPLSRLRPEQVAGGIIQASSLQTLDANSHILFQLQRFGEQNEFIQRYGDSGDAEFDARAGTISQRLLLMNGKLVKERTQQNLVANAATRIAALAPDAETAVEIAYLAVLTRRPTSEEVAHFAPRLAGRARQQPLEDLYWVLLNGSEFSWNH